VEDAVANLGRAVFFGALTTAVGFLALLLSGSDGFTQLGVLIAIGILVAGLLMTTMFFLFVPRQSSPQRHDWILALVKKYVRRMLRAPALILWIATPLLFLLFAIALHPSHRLSSTQARGQWSPSQARQVTRFSDHAENANALGAGPRLVKARDEQHLHDVWRRSPRIGANSKKTVGSKAFHTGRDRSFAQTIGTTGLA